MSSICVKWQVVRAPASLMIFMFSNHVSELGASRMGRHLREAGGLPPGGSRSFLKTQDPQCTFLVRVGARSPKEHTSGASVRATGGDDANDPVDAVNADDADDADDEFTPCE